MQPRMSESELRFFESFLTCSDRYLEFGSGGSTFWASRSVKRSVVSIDSSPWWIKTVADFCKDQITPIVPELVHVDIGPTGDWGVPIDQRALERWPNYHNQIWLAPTASEADLYMVDGRFRVACFMQIALHCEIDAIIMLHDFASRQKYHIVGEVAREIARVEDLSVFQLRREKTRSRALEILKLYEVAYD